MTIDPCRHSIHDEVMTSALVRAVANLLDDLIERVLRTDDRVATAAQGKLLIAATTGWKRSRTVCNASSWSRHRPYGSLPVAPA